QAKTAVVGLGYVGLPLAVELGKAGYRVIGVDIDPEKIEELKGGHSYILDVQSDDVRELINSGKLSVSTSYDVLSEADTISICVPTPLRKTKDPDLSYITAAVEEIKRVMSKDTLIILESTTYPGTTEELVQAEIEKEGYEVGKDFYLCFSPERVDPANKVYNTKNTPKVIGGVTPVCTELAQLLYGSFLEQIVPVSSTKVAETVKLLENTFRAVNIGLVNEIALMCDRMGIDVWEVIEAAATKPFGFMPFYPGPGIGGHCIPLDPSYLSWKAKTFNFYNKFIELASDVNANMPRYVVSKTSEILNLDRKPINGSRILLLGMAYKKDIDDLRESPGLEVYELLREKGAEVQYNDPLVPRFRDKEGRYVYSIELTPGQLQAFDCVILITDHSAYDYAWIADHARVILDTRNAFKAIRSSKIVKLGCPIA
ncbi:MAG: nucleotide sugar dehydrogenase, partial [Syntrophomonadaceae bacterium]|nr:nucleotide sugar dehydrogenase [Syntrophomonadaceae bacterium]